MKVLIIICITPLVNIGIYFEEQNIDTLRSDSELYLIIYAGFAQSESESMSKNITWTYRKKFEEGKPTYCYSRWLGYRKDEDGNAEIVPEEAAIVERIFNLYLSGQSIQAISDILNGERITVPGKHITFSRGMIRHILTNEKYCGDCILQKTVTIDCISKKRKPNEGEAPMYYVENCHPAIISRAVFNRVQQELTRRGTIKPKTTKYSYSLAGHHSKYALTDVLKCAECGTSYRRVTWTAGGKYRVVWRCINRLENGHKYCTDSITVPEPALHAAIVRAFKQFYLEGVPSCIPLMKETIADAIGMNGWLEEINLLNQQITAMNGQLKSLVDMVADSGMLRSRGDELKNISDHIYQLNRQIDEIQSSHDNDVAYNQRLAHIQNSIAEAVNVSESEDDAYDDSVVRQMIECIKVYSEGYISVIFGGGYEIIEKL